MSFKRSIERKVYKKRKHWKKWKSNRNYLKNLQKKNKEKRTSPQSYRSKSYREYDKPKTVPVPPLFSLPANRENVLGFFHDLNKIEYPKVKHVFFDFRAVTDFSHGAVTILLSIIGWLNDRGIRCSGNFPEKKDIKEKFEKSGFLDFFRTIGMRSYEKGMSTIVAREHKNSNAVLTAKLIRKTTKTIWGIEDKNMKVQGMLIELMANTINHAYLGKTFQKGWYFSVDHILEEHKVKFSFVDNGSGILKTLNRKFPDRIAKFIGKNGNIIQRAFEGEFGSRTKLSNRGRGLRAIKKVFELGYVKSLKVITNNIFYDFENGTTEELHEPFDGTFYFWEIDNTCKR